MDLSHPGAGAPTFEDDPPLRCTCTIAGSRSAGAAVVLTLEGDLDLVTAPLLADWIETAVAHGPVIVDLAGVGVVDSVGLEVLARAAVVGDVSVRRARPAVARSLELTRTRGFGSGAPG